MSQLPDLSIAHYRHFLLVAELRSFRAAAARAFRSQPALSLSIREMEQRLGQPLFERGARVSLTRFGESCLPLARELVDHHDRVAMSIGGMARSETGLLTMAAVATAASLWIPDLVARYRAAHPDVAMRLYDDNSEGVERMVLAGQAELGICSPVLSDKRLVFDPLWRDEFGLVCRDDHPLAERAWLTWKEVAGLPLIGTVAHRQLAGHRAAAFMMNLPVFVSHMMSLTAMLERGVGVTVLAELGKPPDARNLVFVPLRRPRIGRVLGMTRLAGRTLSPAASVMEALLRETAATSAHAA
ncbi:LysR family transcriptional regulator [Bordetella genomosp. 11]|uniref:LysR family transcriptional regulator n=1 Tax=Bordetella genomosp. 11 TaxID=1416808 RepID=A0A261UKT4_9BORD|nr:LysR family transcriptional regulator [Bordetella genomosp. 11]OZI62494.1 LysR family transcriptional regulator [Bordetella genomosp. 11]